VGRNTYGVLVSLEGFRSCFSGPATVIEDFVQDERRWNILVVNDLWSS
jgi:hypothetical protein